MSEATEAEAASWPVRRPRQGRPRRADGYVPGPASVETQKRQIKAYVSEREQADVTRRASLAGMKVSAYLKKLIERDELDDQGRPTWSGTVTLHPIAPESDIKAVKTYVELEVWREVDQRAQRAGLNQSLYLRALIKRDQVTEDGRPVWAPAPPEQLDLSNKPKETARRRGAA